MLQSFFLTACKIKAHYNHLHFSYLTSDVVQTSVEKDQSWLKPQYVPDENAFEVFERSRYPTYGARCFR